MKPIIKKKHPTYLKETAVIMITSFLLVSCVGPRTRNFIDKTDPYRRGTNPEPSLRRKFGCYSLRLLTPLVILTDSPGNEYHPQPIYGPEEKYRTYLRTRESDEVSLMLCAVRTLRSGHKYFHILSHNEWKEYVSRGGAYINGTIMPGWTEEKIVKDYDMLMMDNLPSGAYKDITIPYVYNATISNRHIAVYDAKLAFVTLREKNKIRRTYGLDNIIEEVGRQQDEEMITAEDRRIAEEQRRKEKALKQQELENAEPRMQPAAIVSGAPAKPENIVSAAEMTPDELLQNLRKLKALREEGLLSEEEYEPQRQEFMKFYLGGKR